MKKIIHTITNWEAWPFKLIYAPITPVWLWYIIRSGAVWFFTPSNPKLTFGGMEGEPKKEMYDLLPKDWYPTTFNVKPSQPIEEVIALIAQNGIEYPLIVKPEVGGQGVLFRKIDHVDELKHYHSKVPVEYIVQRMVTYPMEVSVFYIRHPLAEKGTVTGFLHKIPLQVTGDGKLTLEELIMLHPKGGKRLDELKNKHADNWNKIIPTGETYMLSYAANHNRGAHFVDLKDQIDDRLVALFDGLSKSINDFYYGRYDIMCNSVEDLKQGKNFSILEYNGCGAEPNHFYDTGYSLWGAYREILRHWKSLYQISKYNASLGIKPWPLMKGRRFLRNAQQMMEKMKVADTDMG